MCGIYGYIGKKENASDIVLAGLKKLEYRGYDSWGIAEATKEGIKVEKHVGKIGNASVTLPASTLAIGHTRWATHGGVTEINAHPHLDCTGEIAVLHNGIVENFAVLKKELLSLGHTFISETDTEVIVHLIEEYSKEYDFIVSVQKAFSRLQGLNAIVAMTKNSEELIACKNGSPLVAGIGDNEYFLASDPTGIVIHTKKVIFLKDNEMIVMGNELKLYSLPSGEEIEPTIEEVDWVVEESMLGTYEHYMLKEIYDQEKIIRTLATSSLSEIEKIAQVIKKAKGTFFIGAGTAYHACLAGVYLFSTLAKRHVNTAFASEFNYSEDFLNEESLIVALSQSGETIDVIEPLQRAKGKGTKIVGIVNNLGSTIYRMADHKLLIGAGPELAVASTKAYVSKLVILLLIISIMIKEEDRIQKLLLDAADEVKRLLDEKQIRQMKKIAIELTKSEHIYTIGRGTSFPTALEAALKIKEVSYIHTEGLAGGELKHGPIALISKGTPCLVFAPHDETYDAIISNAMEIKARGGVIVGISPEDNPVFDHFIEVKDLKEVSVITQIIPAQLLAYFMAVELGLDPDKPRNLAKSVTVK